MGGEFYGFDADGHVNLDCFAPVASGSADSFSEEASGGENPCGGCSRTAQSADAGPLSLKPRKLCMVPSCQKELLDTGTSISRYELRCKLCQECQRADAVEMDGEQRRWCQRCTRLQPVSDFSGQKRSCRAGLASHSQRRRCRATDPSGKRSRPAAPREGARAATRQGTASPRDAAPSDAPTPEAPPPKRTRRSAAMAPAQPSTPPAPPLASAPEAPPLPEALPELLSAPLLADIGSVPCPCPADIAFLEDWLLDWADSPLAPSPAAPLAPAAAFPAAVAGTADGGFLPSSSFEPLPLSLLELASCPEQARPRPQQHAASATSASASASASASNCDSPSASGSLALSRGKAAPAVTSAASLLPDDPWGAPAPLQDHLRGVSAGLEDPFGFGWALPPPLMTHHHHQQEQQQEHAFVSEAAPSFHSSSASGGGCDGGAFGTDSLAAGGQQHFSPGHLGRPCPCSVSVEHLWTPSPPLPHTLTK